MKDSLRLIFVGLVIASFITASLYFLNTCVSVEDSPPERDTVTVTIRDTVTVVKPVAVESKPIGLRPVTLPLWCSQNTDSCTADSACCSDSATVALPIEQKIYETEDYRAVISGYAPSLDTLAIFRQTQYITISERQPVKRWAIGPAIGIGWNGKEIAPFVGVTVSYTLWKF